MSTMQAIAARKGHEVRLVRSMLWWVDALRMHVLDAVLSAAHACGSEVLARLFHFGSSMRWLHGTGLACQPRVLLSRKLTACLERGATLVKE